MTTTLRRGAAALLALAAPAVVAGFALGYGGETPDPVPTHWDLSGTVDGTTGMAPFTTAVALTVGVASLLALALVALSGRRPVAPYAAGSTWLAWMPATLYAATLSAAHGEAKAKDVDLPLAAVVVATVVPFLAALLVHRLLPPAEASARPAPPAAPLVLPEGERVAWVGQAASHRLLVVAGVLALAVVPLLFAGWPAALVSGAAALLAAWVHAVTVRVSNDGVVVSWGPAQWPPVRLTLDQIAAAEVTEIEPLRWGGWGYRRTTRGRAAVARRGEGLVLRLTDGQHFAVTVDRPEPAAELVNALLARHHAPR